MADRNHIADKSTMHRYRVELPILIDDLDLSVYEFRLYVRLKRRAGDGGSCWEGARALAKACNMSAGQIAKAKKGLEEKGLIHIGTRQTRGGQTDDITLVDIWPQNFRTYSKDESDHHTITSPESDHHTITSDEAITTRSPKRVSDRVVDTLTSKRSPGDRKNHDQYHIEITTESPPPTMRDVAKNGAAAPGGDGDEFDLFRELRRRYGISRQKAQEIADLGIDAPTILESVENLHDPADPQSMGRIILRLLDAPPAPGKPYPPKKRPATSAPPLVATRPNMPDQPLSAAELAKRARERHAPS